MKYVIIIPDGAADAPLEELEGKTPFEAANKPHTDRMSIEGRQGTVATTPASMSCGSDICCMNLLGYDPLEYHTGRAPLEAAALGIELDDRDWIFRVNCITVIDGLMQDHSAGHITSEEATTLLRDFSEQAELPGMLLYPGVSYRHIMVDTSGREGTGRDWQKLQTTPPHDVPGEPMRKVLPKGGKDAELLQSMVAQSEVCFLEHEVNQTRRELGELPATHLWPWGQGTKPNMPSFKQVYGLNGAMITAVDLLAGIASFIGWDRLEVPGQTSYHDTDYAAAGQHAVAALEQYDIVCVHVEAPDEAGHAADPKTKVASVEAIDQHIVAPLLAYLESQHGDDWRMLYLPDHYTLCSTRKHNPTPVPFALMGKRIRSVLQKPFNEANAADSDLHIEFGHELMEYFLRAGM